MSWRENSAVTFLCLTASPSSLISVCLQNYFKIIFDTSGIWAWATSLHFISASGIDPLEVLYPPISIDDHPEDSPRPHHLTRRDTYTPVYAIAIILTTVTFTSLTIFWRFTSGDASAVVSYEYLPLSCFAAIFGLAMCPFNIIYRDERFRFLRVLKRIAVGGLDKEGKFGDIMLADILTSYAKVLGDLWVTGCMLLGGILATGKPDRACGGKFAVPLVIRYVSWCFFVDEFTVCYSITTMFDRVFSCEGSWNATSFERT